MSIEEAYTQILACKMWALFGHYATRHGYSVINDYDCSGYSKKDAIQNVLVGTEVGGKIAVSTCPSEFMTGLSRLISLAFITKLCTS
jgi:hypothetical protein